MTPTLLIPTAFPYLHNTLAHPSSCSAFEGLLQLTMPVLLFAGLIPLVLVLPLHRSPCLVRVFRYAFIFPEPCNFIAIHAARADGARM